MAAALPAVASDAALPDRTESDRSATSQFADSSVEPATALQVAQAIAADSSIVTGAEYEEAPLLDGEQVTAGVSTALSGFPTAGSTFGVLSSGLVAAVPFPGTFASTSLSDGVPVRGANDYDVTVMRIDMTVPAGANCLSFDFKFLSEEYPIYVGGSVNDAFVAELNESTWTTNELAEIIAPNNFAFDADGEVVSVNSTGVGGMTPESGVDTAFDGGVFGGGDGDTNGASTVRLAASTEVAPGANSLYLSIFDQGDRILDSAVFLDNLRVGFTPNPGQDCTPGAVVVTHDLTLEPPTGTAPVGGEHTVTATLTTDDGTPVADAEIGFTVAGANPSTGTGTTDAAGQATYTYTGAAPGTDQINACYVHEDDDGCTANASANFVWTSDGKVVERIWGPNRYGTASEISATWSPGVDVVYVATGGNYPDALPASALAGAADVPVLLTRANTLPAVTAAELERLMPQEIVILGGDKAVNPAVETALAEYVPGGEASVSRLYGANRYGTAAAVAMEFGTDVNVAYVAFGENFPDALTGAARAGLEEGPVLLTRTNQVPAETIAALEAINADHIVVLGGTGVVSDAVMTALEDYTDGAVTRIAGANRFETSALISGLYPESTDTVFIATGKEFADALTGGPIAVSEAAPVLLVRPDELPAETIAELERLAPERIVILGGTAAVSFAVEVALAAYLN